MLNEKIKLIRIGVLRYFEGSIELHVIMSAEPEVIEITSQMKRLTGCITLEGIDGCMIKVTRCVW